MKNEKVTIWTSIVSALTFQEKMEAEGYLTKITLGVNNVEPNGFIKVHYWKEIEDED